MVKQGPLSSNPPEMRGAPSITRIGRPSTSGFVITHSRACAMATALISSSTFFYDNGHPSAFSSSSYGSFFKRFYEQNPSFLQVFGMDLKVTSTVTRTIPPALTSKTYGLSWQDVTHKHHVRIQGKNLAFSESQVDLETDLLDSSESDFEEDDEFDDIATLRRRENAWNHVQNLLQSMKRILHHSDYALGERLSPEDERLILDGVLPYHPDFKRKIGCGIESIKVDWHNRFQTRCFFLTRVDGTDEDFSYHKCLRGLAGTMDPELKRLYDQTVKRKFSDKEFPIL